MRPQARYDIDRAVVPLTRWLADSIIIKGI